VRGLFLATKSYLKKLQSIDSKAIKLALGIPWGIQSGMASFHLMKLIQILAAAKFIIKGSSVANHTNNEVELRSDKHRFEKGLLRTWVY